MYYEEKLIDNVWWWRGTPTGDWRKMTVKQLTQKIEDMRLQYEKECL